MIDTVLFDLDGTVIDTNELIIQTFLHVFKDQTAPFPLTRELIISFMGKPLLDLMRYYSGREHVDDLIEAYREFNTANHDELVKEIPYVREVLTTLHEQGIQLGIVTTKIRSTSLKGLEFCGLDKLIQAIVTIEDVDYPKPHPQPVLRAMEALGADPQRTAMVGDTGFDIQAANGAGITSIGVGWSLQSEKDLRLFQPDYINHDMRDLLPLVGLKGILL